jgi:hypothetical protein
MGFGRCMNERGRSNVSGATSSRASKSGRRQHRKEENPVVLQTASVENLTLNITEEIHVRASLDATFDALLEQMGPGSETRDGQLLQMVIEARPGGRWFRDLGNDNGHFWGLVQAIKRPTLLEITGPLFMSYPVVSNVQYRLKEVEGGTLITFRHSALGFVPDDVGDGLSRNWTQLLESVRTRAEAGRVDH